MTEFTEEQQKLFMSKIRPETGTGHWLWAGKPDKLGYGRFLTHHRAHRAAWLILCGEIPAGMTVTACETRHCVNPEHLDLAPKGSRRPKPIPAPADGLEAEYGPVPPRVPNDQWHDHVAVEQALAGRPSRRLTPPEMEDLITRTLDWPLRDLADRLGKSEDAVYNSRHHYTVTVPARRAAQLAA